MTERENQEFDLERLLDPSDGYGGYPQESVHCPECDTVNNDDNILCWACNAILYD